MPKLRPLAWVIIVVNVLFVLWIFGGVSDTASNCDGETGDMLTACQAGTAIGAGIGVAMIMFLWVIVDFILLVLFLVTRRKGRECPVCGVKVKTGVTSCSKCGHDFRISPAASELV